jgi:antitoxin (DNA-binding transcriptional repressor) of toxin-antitoxin stability system
MAQTLTVTQLARNFAYYINRVTYCHERFILTKANRPVAEIRPLPRTRKLWELPAILSSIPHFTVDEAESFGRDIDEARERMNKLGIRDPWEY